MRGSTIYVIALIWLLSSCCVAAKNDCCCANVFCKTLCIRSIAPKQPFQLPTYDEDLPKFIFSLAEDPYNMEIEIDGGWIYVNKHDFNHAELLSVFKCCD